MNENKLLYSDVPLDHNLLNQYMTVDNEDIKYIIEIEDKATKRQKRITRVYNLGNLPVNIINSIDRRNLDKTLTESQYLSLRKRVDAKNAKMEIEKRRNWKKFGAAKYNNNTTIIGEDVQFELVSPELIEKYSVNNIPTKTEEKKATPPVGNVTCRNCGGSHFTHKCVSQKLIISPRNEPREKNTNRSIKIDNLPEDSNYNDLMRLFGQYGRIAKFVLKSYFAFLTYTNENDAKVLLEKNNGIKYNNCVLSLAWASY